MASSDSDSKPLYEYFTDIKYTDFTKLDGAEPVTRMAEMGRFGAYIGKWSSPAG